MIILKANIENLTFSKSKRYSPIAANRNRPLFLSVSFELMQVETMDIDAG
jgi:hypothetical protein